MMRLIEILNLCAGMEPMLSPSILFYFKTFAGTNYIFAYD